MSRTIRLIRQRDAIPESGGAYRVQWILDGVSKKTGKLCGLHDTGWTWVRGVGCPGAWVTRDVTTAGRFVGAGIHLYDNSTGEEIREGL